MGQDSSNGKKVKKVEREINSFEVAVELLPLAYSRLGRKFVDDVIDDSIVHDVVVKLYYRKDELITEIIDPVLMGDTGM
ncbi:hypothetical protein [Peribacillus simplex]|uniref:hypothetical protein n=1 Tax=Peribacillus simplex TaxID=1478 RepID=UPI003D280AA3